MGGWHTVLFRGCLDVASGIPTKEPTGKTLMLSSGTSNFKWMAACWWWGWALKSKDENKISLSSQRILDLYAEEKTIGHQLREQTCPQPHDTFHRGAHAVIRKLAVESNNSEILAANNQWWVWRLALDHAGATPDGQVILPGCRGDGGPFTQIGDSVYRMFQGLPQQGPAKSEKWWKNKIYGGGAPSIMRELHGDGPWDARKVFDCEGPWMNLPKLRLPMDVDRDSNEFSAHLIGSPEDEPIISSVKVKFGRVGHHTITFEKNWEM